MWCNSGLGRGGVTYVTLGYSLQTQFFRSYSEGTSTPIQGRLLRAAGKDTVRAENTGFLWSATHRRTDSLPAHPIWVENTFGDQTKLNNGDQMSFSHETHNKHKLEWLV